MKRTNIFTLAVLALSLTGLGIYEAFFTDKPLEQDRPFNTVRVSSVRYLTKDNTAVPTNWNTTEVQYDLGRLGTYRDLHYCGDVRSEFTVGSMYRVRSRPVVPAGNRDTGYSCLRIMDVESIPESAQVVGIRGKIDNVSDDDPETVTVTLRADSGEKRVALCNDNANSIGFKFDGVAKLMKDVVQDPSVGDQTLFYNETGRSSKFKCYPLLGLARTTTSAQARVLLTENMDQMSAPTLKKATEMMAAELPHPQAAVMPGDATQAPTASGAAHPECGSDDPALPLVNAVISSSGSRLSATYTGCEVVVSDANGEQYDGFIHIKRIDGSSLGECSVGIPSTEHLYYMKVETEPFGISGLHIKTNHRDSDVTDSFVSVKGNVFTFTTAEGVPDKDLHCN